MRALIGRQRQAFAVRQLPDIDPDGGAHEVFSDGLGDARHQGGGDFVLGHHRPGVDVDVRAVAGQADARCCGRRPSRRSPARHHWRRSSRSPCARVLPWRCRSDVRSRRRSRSPAAAACPSASKSSPGYRDFRRAAAAACRPRSSSASARLHWRRASRRRRRRRSRCRPAARLPPGAASRARIPRASR